MFPCLNPRIRSIMPSETLSEEGIARSFVSMPHHFWGCKMDSVCFEPQNLSIECPNHFWLKNRDGISLLRTQTLKQSMFRQLLGQKGLHNLFDPNVEHQMLSIFCLGEAFSLHSLQDLKHRRFRQFSSLKHQVF